MTNFRMIIVGLLLFGSLTWTSEIWLNDYKTAIQQSKAEEKPILLVFSGADWCKPCIRLNQQVFQTETFEEYAQDNLILLKADFPRKRKNRLSETQQEHNDKLAEQFNPNGIFPYVILLSDNGQSQKIIQTDVKDASQFIQQLK